MAGKRILLSTTIGTLLKQFQKRVSLTFIGLFLGTTTILLCIGSGVFPVNARVLARVPIIQTLPNTPQLMQQGEELYESGNFSKAVTVWQQALSTFTTQDDKLNQAKVLSNLSLAYQQLGQWSQAIRAISDSLKLLQTSSTLGASKQRMRILAQALNTQGSLQLAQGQIEQALTTWQHSATIYAQVGARNEVTGSLINQAQALQNLGLGFQAKETLTRVEQALELQPDSIMKAIGLCSLGNTLRAVGDLAHSQQVLQQSLAIAQKLKSSQQVSAALFSLGNTAHFQHDSQAALKFFQQATDASPTLSDRIQAQIARLNLLVETKSWSDVRSLWSQIQPEIVNLSASRATIYARINLAQSLMQMRQTSNSPSLLEVGQLLATAVAQARSISDRRTEAYALGYLGRLYERTQQWSDAQSLTQQALALAQSIDAPDISYRWQWQLGRLLKARGDIEGAIAAYTLAVNNLKTLRSDLVSVNPDIQFSFRDEVEPVYRQLVDLLLQPEGASPPSQQNLVQARSTIESLQIAELDNFFRSACLQGKPLLLDQVVDRDDPTAAVIYPIILPTRLAVILKLPEQPLRYYHTTIAHSEVESLLEELQQKLTEPYTLREVQTLSNQVYDWLIRAAEADLAKSRVKTLVFVLDESIRNIPMAVLHDGQHYLIEKYGVALTPSLQLLPPKPIEQVKLKALIAGLTEARKGFSALTNVALELERIKAELPSTELLNQKFTSTALQQEIDSVPFSVVHFATHGQFSSQADRTFILAWDKPIYVDELNGLLQSTASSQGNALELLVLSACETATGDKRAALGLAGVAVRAGAHSTLASLWSLDDESSALLMSQFYRELADAKVSKAEALRRAQLNALHSRYYRHPMYWSGLVLVGNWL